MAVLEFVTRCSPAARRRLYRARIVRGARRPSTADCSTGRSHDQIPEVRDDLGVRPQEKAPGLLHRDAWLRAADRRPVPRGGPLIEGPLARAQTWLVLARADTELRAAA
ncbi:hypothetical protein HBB16_18010 [Pseudonocardia sp. MCCB 268]|nr:hypothetical protein [Pseudonocardia cytotoxica]